MNDILKGLRIIEGSAFVAAPSAGMQLAQLGADVIRFDPLRGGLDARRWPLSAGGKSLYWASLNKGKRSLAIDTRKPEGQEIITALITAPGPGNGIYLTNFPVSGWLGYEALRKRRDDLIMLNLLGNPDGSSAIDYTVNCAVGVPFATGPAHGAAQNAEGIDPINASLPAWDLITGVVAMLGVLAAERHRTLTGQGQYVKLSLSDVAMAMMGNLGYIAEAQINQANRQPIGNYLYGSYGKEFATKDGRYVYVAAITDRMWTELGRTTGLTEKFKMIEPMLEVNLAREGDRYIARDAITAVLAPWMAAHSLDEVKAAFADSGVCWGPYQTFRQMVAEDPRCSTANPMFQEIEQPGIGTTLVPGSPLDFSGLARKTPRAAPRLGEHTDEILSGLLGMSDTQIAKLRDAKVVAGPVDV
ncbi:MAG: 2-methylfumaryl-CoA isomerase [Azospirillum sp.]|nr:2-methylfumaryl-CoA isomerase [Azospirillum sp.]